MPVRFQLVVDCADPDLLARFWDLDHDAVGMRAPEGNESDIN